MRKQTGTIIFAVFLILIGGVSLLENLNMIPWALNVQQPLLAALFGLGSLAFLAVFLSNPRESWWAIIPGFVLIGIAMLIGLPVFQGEIGGSMFLGMISLAFWVVFVTAPRERWWAIIPGGVLATLAAIIVIEPAAGSNDMLVPAALFLGLGLTFAVVYLVTRMRWAIWPAGVLMVMGSLFFAGQTGLAGLVFPILLIGLGGLLVLRSFLWKAR